MATTYVALLRGINVGGRNPLPMSQLRQLFTDLRYDDVATYVQSGNVVFVARQKTQATIAKNIRDGISRISAYDVPVIVRSATQIHAIVERNPWLSRGVDTTSLHVTFFDGVVSASTARSLAAIDSGSDAIEVLGQEAFLYCPNGYGRTKLTNTTLERRLATTATTRNWRTVVTLSEMMGTR